ncbi:hypothetical protein MNBD_ALPHA11-2046 [hydrothermal vent metagenome]|uniref:Uncharacterized protein n=1 Tax=hydrothermal vent metagenome TaxID=652676 RepID=A0A3B0TV92_9ZZZZ
MLILKKLNTLHYWALLNIVLPIIVEFALGIGGISDIVRGTMIYGTVVVLLMGNIYLLQVPSKFSWLVGSTLALNLAALALLGKISFFTAIPVLPLLFSGAAA